MDKKHLFSLSLTLIIVMLFSALGPTTVYADDGVPPDAPTAEVSETDGEAVEEVATEAQTDETGEGQAEAVATEEVVTELPADETGEEQPDEAAASEEGTAELPADETGEELSDEATAEEPSLMEQVPENTEVVVINAEGEAEPLATQEAANAVVESDPIWCPAGQDPTPGANNCTGSFSSFDGPDGLLTFLKANEGNVLYQQAGTIYIEMGAYGGGESSIVLNPDEFTYLDANPLTIQGGWDISADYNANPLPDFAPTGNTTFNIPMLIGSETNPWSGAVTIRNISISQVQGDTPALAVYSSGNVTVEDSEVNDNGSDSWNVVDGEGLKIRSGGSVSLNGVIANDNQIFGADIRAIVGGTLSSVAIANSTFNGNLMFTSPSANPPNTFLGYGLTVVSQGDIAITGIEANGNYLYGAWFDGPRVSIYNSTFNENLTNSDLYVDDMGLVIVTTGNATLDGVEANDNRMIGADIQADGQVSIANSSFSRNYGVTVDASEVETYWGCGLQVGGVQSGIEVGDIQDCNPQTTSASYITMTSVVANNNYFFGADLFSSGDVNISDISSFSNVTYSDGINDGFPQEQLEGLKIRSGGEVTLSNIKVWDNQTLGADIEADGDIRSDGSSYFHNLNGSGLLAKSNGGSIYLDDVTATSNGVDGVYLETNNRYVCITGGSYVNNVQYNAQIINSTYEVVPTIDNIFTSGSTSGECPSVIIPPPPPTSPEAPLYTVTALTQGQLAALGQGNAFVSALQVSGQVTNGVTLAFPIPAGMEGADLAVMFWNGSGWVEVLGGSVVGSEFVITVTQPGIYVLVSQQT